MHYKSLTVKGFRSIRETKIKNFSQINVFLGKNNPAYSAIFNCFDTYCKCISGNYSAPKNKDKIFAYLDVLSKETLAEKRNFLDEDCWNIAHPNLDKLRNFLLKIFES